MNLQSLFHAPTYRLTSATLVVLVALAWSTPAFCGPIHDAVYSNDLEKVKALLKGDPGLVFSRDKNGATPLGCAVIRNHRDVAEFLLANKADANVKLGNGWTVLHTAAQFGYKEMVKLLLAHKADVNAKDNSARTPLHFAAHLRFPLDAERDQDYPGTVELLLAGKADVNAKDNDGQTPLQLAVAANHEDVARVLRQHGGHD